MWAIDPSAFCIRDDTTTVVKCARKYGILPPLPYTPGNDGAGIINAIGSEVQRLVLGQRVFVAAALAKRNTGTYAEYAVCDADAVHSLPERFSFSEGAGLGTPGLAATYVLFSRAELRPGETVLVHGATGGVGTLAVQLAKKAGAVVFGTAGSEQGERLLRTIGAHHIFNHNEEGYLEQIQQKSSGGPDVIIEMLANVNLAKNLSILAKHGRIVIVGNRGALDFNPRDAMLKDAIIHGILINNMPNTMFIENMFRLAAALENGLRVVVDQELPLQNASEAHKKLLEGHKYGKVILMIS